LRIPHLFIPSPRPQRNKAHHHPASLLLLEMLPVWLRSMQRTLIVLAALLLACVVLWTPLPGTLTTLVPGSQRLDGEHGDAAARPPSPSPPPPPPPPPPTKARYLSPAELMDRPLAPTMRAIPKLFHQSWSTTELPKKFAAWSERCRTLHPDWEWVLWTDDDNARLFERYLPWLVDTFQHLPGPIYQADLSRNAYMLLFGGFVLTSLHSARSVSLGPPH
jgi:hypothetical protein